MISVTQLVPVITGVLKQNSLFYFFFFISSNTNNCFCLITILVCDNHYHASVANTNVLVKAA